METHRVPLNPVAYRRVIQLLNVERFEDAVQIVEDYFDTTNEVAWLFIKEVCELEDIDGPEGQTEIDTPARFSILEKQDGTFQIQKEEISIKRVTDEKLVFRETTTDRIDVGENRQLKQIEESIKAHFETY